MIDRSELGGLLESLYEKYNRVEFVENDPISIPHRYVLRDDIEVSGFFAATIAWGNRKAIVKSANRMMELMGDQPHDFVLNASQSELSRLDSYVHRTFNGIDLRCFVLAIRQLYARHGGIGAFFENQWRQTGDIREVLSLFRSEFFADEHPHRSEKHLSSIDKGSACKRLNMYLRWMVRRDGRGVDLGLWREIPQSALYLPLDLHSGNMSRALGLLTRCQSDWRAVEQVTRSLREFDAQDPVKYDFALFGAGVDGFLK